MIRTLLADISEFSELVSISNCVVHLFCGPPAIFTDKDGSAVEFLVWVGAYSMYDGFSLKRRKMSGHLCSGGLWPGT